MISLISDLLQKDPGMYHFVKQCLFQLKGGAELHANRPASGCCGGVAAAARPRPNLEQWLRELDAAATPSLILADACTTEQERDASSFGSSFKCIGLGRIQRSLTVSCDCCSIPPSTRPNCCRNTECCSEGTKRAGLGKGQSHQSPRWKPSQPLSRLQGLFTPNLALACEV